MRGFCCLATRVNPGHQKLTRTSRGLHQSCVVGFTRRAVILKESRGQHPQPSSPASYVGQVTLHLHPFTHAGHWRSYARKIRVDQAATSGGRSNRGIGQSHQLCAQPMVTLDCLMRIQQPFSDGDLLLTDNYCAQSCQVLDAIWV